MWDVITFFFPVCTLNTQGHTVALLFEYTSRNVAVSIPDVVIVIFY